MDQSFPSSPLHLPGVSGGLGVAGIWPSTCSEESGGTQPEREIQAVSEK
jgi:hypothetical protein